MPTLGHGFYVYACTHNQNPNILKLEFSRAFHGTIGPRGRDGLVGGLITSASNNSAHEHVPAVKRSVSARDYHHWYSAWFYTHSYGVTNRRVHSCQNHPKNRDAYKRSHVKKCRATCLGFSCSFSPDATRPQQAPCNNWNTSCGNCQSFDEHNLLTSHLTTINTEHKVIFE